MENSVIPNPAKKVQPVKQIAPIRVRAEDLPLCCPRPEDALWNMHPRVYLAIEDTPSQRVVCPYCGATYELDGVPGNRH